VLNTLDWWVVAAYFAAVFLIAYVVARAKQTRSSPQEYFLAGRHTGWFVIGASLFASNIGSEHLVGLAGTGAASGVAVGQFEVLASLILLLLGWVFVPFYVRSGVVTMPEFLERRYSPQARAYLAGISILGYVLTKISVTIYAGGIVFQALMGIDFWTGALIVVAATGLYTVFGGLRAVMYTDLLQMFVLVGGAITVTVIGLAEIGGWGELRSVAGSGFFSLWRPMSDPDFPWTGILFGAPILGVWYWCTDQFIVQRVLAAPNTEEARKGAIFAGYLKLLPIFIFVIPGVVAYALTQTGRITLGQPDEALPTLVGVLLPAGLRGLVVAGLLAALMSSLSSVFNSCSTLVTWDIYKKMNPAASDRRLVVVGQVVTAGLVVLGLLWIPLMKNISGTLYQYMQSVQAYISPPIAAVFLLGISWKRLNGPGAIASLLTGFVLGMGRLVLELIKPSLPDGLLFAYADMNFLHFAVVLFVICSAVLIGVSLMTAPPTRAQLEGLTFQTTSATGGTPVPWYRRTTVWLSLFLIACVGAVWLYFTG
jgi:SSS family solute:Na+ symporter